MFQDLYLLFSSNHKGVLDKQEASRPDNSAVW